MHKTIQNPFQSYLIQGLVSGSLRYFPLCFRSCRVRYYAFVGQVKPCSQAIYNTLRRVVQKPQRLVTDLQVNCSRGLLSSWIGAEHSRGLTSEPAKRNMVQKIIHSANSKTPPTIGRPEDFENGAFTLKTH